nr:hypothetical protein [Pseudomonas viridiflava]
MAFLVQRLDQVLELANVGFAKQRLMLPDVILLFCLRDIGCGALLRRLLGQFGELLTDLLLDLQVDAAFQAVSLGQIHFLHEVETIRSVAQRLGTFGCGPLQFRVGNMQDAVVWEDQRVFSRAVLPNVLNNLRAFPEQLARDAVFNSVFMQVAAAFFDHIQVAVPKQTQTQGAFEARVNFGIRFAAKSFHPSVAQWKQLDVVGGGRAGVRSTVRIDMFPGPGFPVGLVLGRQCFWII